MSFILQDRTNIPFIDLKAQQECIRPQIDIAIKRVLDHGCYVMGPEVFELEEKLSEFCGVKHAITCANGTDALSLALMAKGVGAGDAILVPSFTFAATAEAVASIGATPVFVDSLPDTYNLDPKGLESGIVMAIQRGLRPVGIIVVDLFGQPADYDSIQKIANQNQLWVLADAAQSVGATYRGKKVGNLGEMTTTSFFPAKPLGCYGDGGAVFTNDGDLAEKLKSLRIHGQGVDKYHNQLVGMNSRLDTIQAAILLEKLKIFSVEMNIRQQTADFYNNVLKEKLKVPVVIKGATSVWAQYTVQLPNRINRTELTKKLKNDGIPTAIYYSTPLHQQVAYSGYPVAGGNSLPMAETMSNSVISLPISGYVSKEQSEYIAFSLAEHIGA